MRRNDCVVGLPWFAFWPTMIILSVFHDSLDVATAFPVLPPPTSASLSSVGDLLAIEQYTAQARRAEVERVLLCREESYPLELSEPHYALSSRKTTTKDKVDPGRGGGGFGGSKIATNKRWSKNKSLALLQKQRLEEDGVVRINQALSPQTCASLRAHVMEELETTASQYQQASLTGDTSFVVEDHYGIEPGRTCRTDLLLSMTSQPVSRALEELFHPSTGKVRALYESLVTKDGTFYELASVVTSQGSHRQCIHPDVPFQTSAPLYVVFAALQDVTMTMGPTTFLLKSHTSEARNAYDCKGTDLDEYLRDCDVRESTMKMGDLVVFDARILHCGNANLGIAPQKDEGGIYQHELERALFNFSFRNPEVVGNLGYKGSMRPGYTMQKITLGNVLDAIDEQNHEKGDCGSSLFARYGNGWGI